ncbi:MAG: hypothetical protein PWR26_501 [Methanosarcinales archaeon]|nr:hypothetical protein [Methanosarcinales archaeon]MDN5294859.1 hypothetical protein [Methanosarcinales archaeon]
MLTVKCRVVSVHERREWQGVVMEELQTRSRVYFPRVPKEYSLEVGDVLRVRMEKLPPELLDMGERTMKVVLLDDEDNVLDWTML